MKEFLNNNIEVKHDNRIFNIFFILEDKRTHDKRTFKQYITYESKKALLDMVKGYNAREKNIYKMIDFEILEEL